MGSQEMYGLAQCTRDLNGSQCTRCITSYAKRLGKLFLNNTGGAIKGYSCYLRYLVAPINITLPPVAAPAPTTSSTDCDCRWREHLRWFPNNLFPIYMYWGSPISSFVNIGGVAVAVPNISPPRPI